MHSVCLEEEDAPTISGHEKLYITIDEGTDRPKKNQDLQAACRAQNGILTAADACLASLYDLLFSLSLFLYGSIV
jgi:hypothetical protein